MLSKSDLIRKVADKSHLPMTKVNDLVNAVFYEISGSLAKGEEVRLMGFGTFRIASRGERTGRNPRTGESMQIPASFRPAFTPGSTLVEKVKSIKKKAA